MNAGCRRFTIIEIGFIYGGENSEAKICRLQGAFGHGQHVYRRRRRRVNTLQIVVEFF